jgi:hypothetical protein
MKLAYGPTGSATVVSSTAGLPVSVISGGITANLIGFCGAVQGIPGGNPIEVSGTVYATGICSAPVYVTTSSGYRVEVTGGIPTTYTRDSITVYGAGGSTFIRSALVTTGNTAIGVSGDALKVFLQDANLTVNVGTNVGIYNSGATSSIRIEGNTSGIPVPVSISGTGGFNDTSILTGITAIFGKVSDVYNALSVFGLVRPGTGTAGTRIVTSSATQLSAGFTCTAGINLKSSSSNTQIIYIGTSGTGSLVGYGLDPGEQVFLDVGNLSGIYLSASGSQNLSYFAS